MPRKYDQPYSTSNQDVDIHKPKRQKLTDSQLERKRELDREAQRTIRERTRNHIAHLEGLVEQLQGEPGSQVEHLVAQLNEGRAEINRLRDALGNIIKTANSFGGIPVPPGDANRHHDHIKDEPSPSGTFDSTGSTIPQPTEHDIYRRPDYMAPATGTEPSFPRSQQHRAPSYRPSIMFPPIEQLLAVDLRSVEDDQMVPAEDATSSAPIAPETDSNSHLSISQMGSSIVGKTKLEGRLWYLAGTLLSHILRTQQADTFISYANDEDIAIRAVFEGWSAVMERYPLDRGWQWLKELDERIYFRHYGPAERLMHLRNSRLQFLHQLYPAAGWNKRLPAFFDPRPSQQFLEHDPLVEHFPWPAFRERLLFSPRQFATNKFMQALRQNIVFVWNYDFKSMYHKDATSGLYLFSDSYINHIMDLRCYSARNPFFEQFPELRQDIPNSEPGPHPMIVTPNQRWFDPIRRHSFVSSSARGSISASGDDRDTEECFDSGYEDTTADSRRLSLGASPSLTTLA